MKVGDSIGKLKITYPFIVVTALLLAFDQSGYLLLSWTAIVFHEAGHLLALWRAGCHVDELCLSLTGLKIAYSVRKQSSYRQDIALALAGPGANFFVALTLSLAARYIPGEETYYFIGINLLLAFFNLLPALPMDGGRALEAALGWHMGTDRAARICSITGAVTGMIIALVGVWVFVVSQGNFTLLVSAGVILLGCRMDGGRLRKGYGG